VKQALEAAILLVSWRVVVAWYNLLEPLVSMIVGHLVILPEVLIEPLDARNSWH
jgi:hypothetical protein